MNLVLAGVSNWIRASATPRNLRIGLTTAAVVASGVILWFGWSVAGQNRKLRAENTALKQTAETPYLIRDFELNALPYLTPVGAASDSSVKETSARFLFVADEKCGFCSQQMEWWEKTITEERKRERSFEVWLISLGTGKEFGELARYLSVAGQPFRQYSANSREYFVLATGVTSVPATVFTRNNRVILAHSGVFSDALFKTALDILNSDPAGARFLRRSAVQPALGRISQ